MKKKSNKNILMIIVFVIGLGFLCYPLISNAWNSHIDRKLNLDYVATVEQLPSVERNEEWDKAIAYNQSHTVNTITKDIFDYNEDEKDEEYEAVLNPCGNGIMGRIKIDRLNLDLPVYHGCGPDALSVGVGHVEGTSLPVGGIGSHSVLSAHRGLANRQLFTDLDQMEEDDIFSLHMLDHDLYYRVDEIQIVLPKDIETVDIDPNEDYCTLVTCTPFAVNTHRLLVRGVRCEKPLEEDVAADVKASRKINLSMQSKLLIGGLLFFILVMILQSVLFKMSDSKKEKDKKGE